MWATSHSILIGGCIAALLGLCGCANSRAHIEGLQSKLLQQEDALWKTYLSTNVAGARHALLEKVRLDENNPALERAGFRFEHKRFLDYACLYVLDKRVGDEPSAEFDLIKARYWYLRACEADNMSSAEIVAELSRANSQGIFEIVHTMESGMTGGKGPMYIRSIRAAREGQPHEPSSNAPK